MRTFLGIVLIGIMVGSVAFAQGNGPGRGDCGGRPGNIEALPYEEVDDTEREDLLYMREEEKLARDVYRAMDDLWGLRALRNIAGAEQTHMNALLKILDKYDILDSVGDAPAGQFANEQLQQLYNDLVAQGSQSLTDALIVGATIEDLDIHDLDEALARTDNEDIRTVYQNLQKGSRNHLRAFTNLLEGSGVTYEPQYLSVDQFEEILSTSMERGRVDADGEPLNCPGRGGPRHRYGRNR